MKPTAAQKKWIAGVQKALSAPGSEGLGFFTIGDNNVSIFDYARDGEIDEIMSSGKADFCMVVDELDCLLGDLIFPNGVYSTAG